MSNRPFVSVSHLVVHDDLVGCGVQVRRECEEFLFAILVLLFVRLKIVIKLNASCKFVSAEAEQEQHRREHAAREAMVATTGHS